MSPVLLYVNNICVVQWRSIVVLQIRWDTALIGYGFLIIILRTEHMLQIKYLLFLIIETSCSALINCYTSTYITLLSIRVI